jgi:putative endonuclease
MVMKRKTTGFYGEGVAAQALQKRGYRLVTKNFCIQGGEIDLIMAKGEELVFVEVKTRRNGLFGSPLESITPQKKSCMMKAAKVYLSGKDQPDYDVRFFAVAVYLDQKDRVEKTEIIEDIFV